MTLFPFHDGRHVRDPGQAEQRTSVKRTTLASLIVAAVSVYGNPREHMADDVRFRTNSPPVVYETVEGETIAVNLDTGTYYDLNAVGGYIFGLLEGGAAAADIAVHLEATLDVERATVDRAVDSFIGLLAEERLIVPDASRDGAPALPDGIEPPEEYADPILHKHVDMQELLLLDPVHEVSDTGWPSRA